MKDVSSLIDFVSKQAKSESRLTIEDQIKSIKSVVQLTAKNYLEGIYTKVFFKEDGYLLIIPQDNLVYYSPIIQKHLTEIPDEDIGTKEIISFGGKDYKLINKDDYQFVLHVFVGTPYDGESEVRFSDYIPVDGSNEILSLGWMCWSGKRADLHCKVIDISEISIS